MSIVREVWVVCDGCGEREPGEVVPRTWPATEVDHQRRIFCSVACMLNALSGVVPRAQRRWPFDLTDREVETLEQLANGLTNAEIGGKLFISKQSVKNVLTYVFKKLRVKNREEAVLIAHAAGLVNLTQIAQRMADQRRLAA